jgi:hypothetical protein
LEPTSKVVLSGTLVGRRTYDAMKRGCLLDRDGRLGGDLRSSDREVEPSAVGVEKASIEPRSATPVSSL